MVLSFALSLSVTLWLQPRTWRIEPDVAGFAVWVLLTAASLALPAAAYSLVAGAYRRRPVTWDSDATGYRFSVAASPRQAVMMSSSADSPPKMQPRHEPSTPAPDHGRGSPPGLADDIFPGGVERIGRRGHVQGWRCRRPVPTGGIGQLLAWWHARSSGRDPVRIQAVQSGDPVRGTAARSGR
ncbi:hypothetical protein [Actinoplanes subtropicus]|uniref:hypothetical protein n=1 Tax=Actinoplanes subtropicus TaxID=543632 RepID=UPI0004C43E88|nr:hypothetical protein [Actinoplanes subtropicus]